MSFGCRQKYNPHNSLFETEVIDQLLCKPKCPIVAKYNAWLQGRGLNKRYEVRKLFTDFNSTEERNYLLDKWHQRFDDSPIVSDLGVSFGDKKLSRILKVIAAATR